MAQDISTPLSNAPEARCDSARRHGRSAGHIFSLLREKIWKKRALERFYSAYAPEKSCRSVLRFVVTLSVVRTPFGRAAESGFPSARHTVQVVSFAPIEYLTYGIRTMSILLRAVGADVGIGPYKDRNTFHGNRQKRLSTPARDFSSEAGARMKAYRVYVESEQRTSGGKDPPEA